MPAAHTSYARPDGPTTMRLAPVPRDGGPRVLVAGDRALGVAGTLRDAEPDVEVETALTLLDALAELVLAAGGEVEPFDAVVAAADEGEEVRALRDQLNATDHPARLVLVGDAGAMAALLRHGGDAQLSPEAGAAAVRRAVLAAPPPGLASQAVPLLTTDVLLDAIATKPGRMVESIVARLAAESRMPLALAGVDAEVPRGTLSAEVDDRRRLVWHAPPTDDAERDVAEHDLRELARDLSRLAKADAQHAKLQRLALHDELTGCANTRYFRQFLSRIIDKARAERFPVTLLMFDIDNFKQYNDAYGHGVGDAILRQTGALIRRCIRDHDFVARVGGDEFAVVFWEKNDPSKPVEDEEHRRGLGRVPKGPAQIAARFRRLMSEGEFGALGTTGEGRLTISGGMAVYPYDATGADELIVAADNALMFGAKAGGKNAIALVGEDEDCSGVASPLR